MSVCKAVVSSKPSEPQTEEATINKTVGYYASWSPHSFCNYIDAWSKEKQQVFSGDSEKTSETSYKWFNFYA